MMQVHTFVAASPIEGVGVFTAEPIARGQVVWSFDPMFDRLIPVADYENARPLVRDFLDKYSYPSPDKPGFLVYETDNGRFMNHIETPNLDFSDNGGATALRDIAPGEELTCNYADFYPQFELMPGGEEIVAGRSAEVMRG
jgi:SET domain-containing protein